MFCESFSRVRRRATAAAATVSLAALVAGCSGGVDESAAPPQAKPEHCQAMFDQALGKSFSSLPEFDSWEVETTGDLMRCEFSPSSRWWFLHADPEERGEGAPAQAQMYVIAVVDEDFNVKTIVEAGPNVYGGDPLRTPVDFTEELALTSSAAALNDGLDFATVEGLSAEQAVAKAREDLYEFLVQYSSPGLIVNDEIRVRSLDVVAPAQAKALGPGMSPARFRVCVEAGSSWVLHESGVGVLGSGTNTDSAVECSEFRG